MNDPRQIDPRDGALQASCPTVIAPRFDRLPDMDLGQRVVVAANGLYLQVRLAWLDTMIRIARVAPVPPLPYGDVTEHTRFAFGVIPVNLLEQFIEAGKAALPNEIAGGLIYSRSRGTLRLDVYQALHSSAAGIEYAMPTLAADETIAIDLHTHGRGKAFWSAIDNRDDQGIKVAGVFGNLHHERPSAAFRLVVNGYYRCLHHPWEQQVAGINDRGSDEDVLEYGRFRGILKWMRSR